MKVENIEFLRKIVYSNPCGWKAFLMGKQQKELLNDILNDESLKPSSVNEKLYWVFNKLNSYPKCPVCSGPIKRFRSMKKGYFLHCSCKCTQLDEAVREKHEKTNILKYGTKNAAQSKIIQDKIKHTCLEKFGSTNVFGSDYGKSKIKQTNILRYGAENPQQNELIKNRTQQIIKTRYGVHCLNQLVKSYKKSKGEIELFEYVKSVWKDAVANDRDAIAPLELDIFVQSINLGIEYDGDYWHSLPDMVKRDLRKDAICKEKNIKLLRIKESEWKNSKNKIKALLKEEKISNDYR